MNTSNHCSSAKQKRMKNTNPSSTQDGVSLLRMAHLNFGLFQQLYHLGTAKDRVCGVLQINASEYDYLATLC
jgi:hypothetical protein